MISKETQEFARHFVTAETHMRRALKLLNAALFEQARGGNPDCGPIRDELRDSLQYASHLPECLMDWTASKDVQEAKHADHIDMVCHIGAFGKGISKLGVICDLDFDSCSGLAKAIELLTEAMVAICDAHVDLKKFCRCDPVVDIPDFPTTRDGGR